MYNPCGMLHCLPRWLCFLAICSVPAMATPLCVTGTLDTYIALGAGGCQIGGVTVVNVSYTFVSGTISIPDTDITVTPSSGSDLIGLTFSSSDFSASGTNSAVYMLSYTWDPGDIRSLEDILNDPPSFPGLAQITTVDCEDAAFSPTCLTSTDTLVVSDNGVTMVLDDSVSFSPTVGTLGIQNTIELEGNRTGTGEFTSFENQIGVPEPSTIVPCLLLTVPMFRRWRSKRV